MLVQDGKLIGSTK